MRIERGKPLLQRARRLRAEIDEAATSEGVRGRVCAESCAVICPTCGSRSCQCACAPDCPDAARALSSDPEAFPVEPAVVALVFELKRTGLFRPCWSCEGHLKPDGAPWKVPRVWFTCDSMVHVRLLGGALEDIRAKPGLNAPWRVVVTFSDRDNPETTFSLEPDLSEAPDVPLTGLQQDAATIARALPALMRDEARKLRRDTETSLG